MKLWVQILVMLVVAIVVHIILSGQLVLFGSLYRFGNQTQSNGSGDLMYLQDKKVVTQKITEYTKITNLQNDITTTLQDTSTAFVQIFSGSILNGSRLYDRLQLTNARGVVITNDGLILVPILEPYKKGDWNVVTSEGNVYKVRDVYSIEGKSFGLLRVTIPKEQELLPKTIDVVSYSSPIVLGQMLLQPQLYNGTEQFSLCMIVSNNEKKQICETLLGNTSQDFLVTMYGQLFGLYETNGLQLITKEQIQQWIAFVEVSTGSIVPQKSYSTMFESITPLHRNILDLSQNQGWLVVNLNMNDAFTGLATGDVVRSINDITPVIGRTVQDLLRGLERDENISFQR